MGDSAPVKISNMIGNIAQDRIAPVEIIAMRGQDEDDESRIPPGT